MSWDKTNQKFKIQKRVEGKVKSYTLPRKFNRFCEILKKYLEVFKAIDEGNTVDDIRKKFGLSYPEIRGVFRKYVEWKIGRNELADLLSEILYELRLYELYMIDDIHNIAWALKHALGANKIKFNCPICKEWTHLRYDAKTKQWVCSKCGEIPF